MCLLAPKKKRRNDSGVKARTELSTSCIFLLLLWGCCCWLSWLSGGDECVFLQVCVVCELGVSGVLHSAGAAVERGWAMEEVGGWVRSDGLTPWTQKDWEAEICCFHQAFPPFLLTPPFWLLVLSSKSEVPKAAVVNMWWWWWWGLLVGGLKIMQGAKKSS